MSVNVTTAVQSAPGSRTDELHFVHSVINHLAVICGKHFSIFSAAKPDMATSKNKNRKTWKNKRKEAVVREIYL
jgi:hypothetical protein